MAEKWKPPTKESENPSLYKKKDDGHYSTKKDHKERTLGNETDRKKGHKDHWRKEKKKDE
jgi:hypothetical protein